MAEKQTPNGLVVGLILEPDDKPVEELPVEELPVVEDSEGNPIGEKPKRSRQPKSE